MNIGMNAYSYYPRMNRNLIASNSETCPIDKPDTCGEDKKKAVAKQNGGTCPIDKPTCPPPKK